MSAARAAEPSSLAQPPRSCWTCRVFSGGGMLLAGAYVLFAARSLAQRAGPSVGTVVQATFAVSLAALGVVVIADPAGKVTRKT